jgi:ABC-2 type transport system permease protein
VRLLVAFLERDVRVAATYWVQAFFGVAGGMMTVTVLHFLSFTVDTRSAVFQGDYFSFALTGIAVLGALRGLQGGFPQAVRQAQLDGSLELLMMAPRRPVHIFVAMAVQPVAAALLRSVGLILLGVLWFRGRFHVDVLGLAGTFVSLLVPHVAIGLLATSFVLVFKRGEPITFALDALSYLFAGVLYPVTVLPLWLQKAAAALPATHALYALRGAMLEARPPAELAPHWWALWLSSAVLWPAAWAAVWWAHRSTTRSGSLSHT